MIDVFTPRRISPDCPFKSNQRQAKISISTSWCAVWLCSVHHTAADWLCSGMHTVESDLAAWCTPWSFLQIWISFKFQKIENTLACLSQARMGLNHGKNGDRNLVTHSLFSLFSIQKCNEVLTHAHYKQCTLNKNATLLFLHMGI